MSLPADQMELSETLIRSHYPAATALIEGFDHSPRIARPQAAASPATTAAGRSPGLPPRRRFRSTTPGLAARPASRPHGVHLADRIEATDDDDPLISPLQATALAALRRAIAIALATGDEFSRATGLARLKKDNLAGTLPRARSGEFSELLAAEALVVLHVLANATAFLLAPHKSSLTVEVSPPREILTDNAPAALNGALWELDQTLATHARDEAHLVPTLSAWAEQLMQAAAQRAANTPRTQPFEAARYHVKADDFTIAGFTPARALSSQPLVMDFKRPDQVIGNHIAKHQAMRLAKMLMAYDFDRRLNPFAELGGFIFTFIGDGLPGTGKTLLIQMMAGLIHDYAQVAGYPFRYQNFSIDQIDSYQGKSGQNARAFIEAILDHGVIGFGTIDDIDQVAGRRGDRQSSAGQQEVTAVLMQAFAGANTVVRGNATFGMFSNYPEAVDDALRQRAGARFLVDGPQTRADYIDILALLLGRDHDIALGDHDLMATQEIRAAVARSYAAHDRPREKPLAEILDRTLETHGPLDTIAALGSYLKEIQKHDPRFTGRAIKNITDAVKVRAMDFDLPDEWMERPELFLHKDYDTKLAMIRELRNPITPQMVLQEINRYADSEFRYAGKADEAAIADMLRQMRLSDEARRRYREGGR